MRDSELFYWGMGLGLFAPWFLLQINSLVLIDPPGKHKTYRSHPPWRFLNKIGKALCIFFYTGPIVVALIYELVTK